MEDISLSKESRERIADAVSGHFEAQDIKSTGSRFTTRSFANRWGLIAAAAIVLLVVFAVPYGIRHTNPKGTKSDNASLQEQHPASGQRAQDLPEEEGNGSKTGNKGADNEGQDHISQVSEPGAKNTDPAWILGYKNGQVSTAECTACRYALKGTTVEGIMTEILATRDGAESRPASDYTDADVHQSYLAYGISRIAIPEAEEAGVNLFGKDGKVLYAIVPDNEYAVVCSFLYPTDPVAACNMAVNLAGFPFE